MSGTVFVRHYDAPPIDRREILRYAGVRGEAPELEAVLTSCLEELTGRLSYRVCFTELAVAADRDTVRLGETVLRSADLSRRLEGCSRAVVVAATVGNEPDRLIARYNRVSPARALMLQAVGTERVEALCDCFEAELREDTERQGGRIRQRFSPGYGDLSLALQSELFRLLDCPRRIGVVLNESLLMSPSKSVTAIIGIEKSE